MEVPSGTMYSGLDDAPVIPGVLEEQQDIGVHAGQQAFPVLRPHETLAVTPSWKRNRYFPRDSICC